MYGIFILLLCITQWIAGETTGSSNAPFGNPADVRYVDGTAAPEIVAGPASPAAKAYFASTMRPKTGLSQYATSERLVTDEYDYTPSSRTVSSTSAPLTASTSERNGYGRGLSRYQTAEADLSEGYVNTPTARNTFQSASPQSGQSVVTIGGTKAHSVPMNLDGSIPNSQMAYSSSSPVTTSSNLQNGAVSNRQHYAGYMSDGYSRTAHQPGNQHHVISFGIPVRAATIAQPTRVPLQRSGALIQAAPALHAVPAIPTVPVHSQQVALIHNAAYTGEAPGIVDVPVTQIQQHHGVIQKTINVAQPAIKTRKIEVRRPAIRKQFYDIEEHIIVRPAGSVLLELDHPLANTNKGETIVPIGGAQISGEHGGGGQLAGPQPNTIHSGQSHPDTHQPGVHPNDVHQPDVYQPDVHQPNAHQPDAHQPGTHQPDTHQPDAYQPDAHQPDAHQPDAHQPDVHQPDVHQPLVSQPDAHSDNTFSDNHQPVHSQPSPEINIPYGDSTYVVKQPGGDYHPSSSTQPPDYDNKYNPLAPKDGYTQKGYLRQDIIYADNQNSPKQEVSSTPATFILATTSTPQDYDDSIVIEAKHSNVSHPQSNYTAEFRANLPALQYQAYNQQDHLQSKEIPSNNQHQGYYYDSSRLESEKLIQPQYQRPNSPAQFRGNIQLSQPQNQNQAQFQAKTPRVQYEENFQSQQYPPPQSIAYQQSQQYRTSQPRTYYRSEQNQPQQSQRYQSSPPQTYYQNDQNENQPRYQQSQQYRTNQPQVYYQSEQDQPKFSNPEITQTQDHIRRAPLRNYPSHDTGEVQVSRNYPLNQSQQQVQLRSNLQTSSHDCQRNHQQPAQFRIDLSTNAPHENNPTQSYTPSTTQSNDFHHQPTQGDQHSSRESQLFQSTQQTKQRALLHSQPPSPHMIAIGQPDFQYPPYVEAHSNGAPLSTHTNYAVKDNSQGPTRGDVVAPTEDHGGSFPSVTPSPRLTPEESNANQKHFIELLFARGKVSEIGFGPTASPQGLVVPSNGYIRSRVISATPAPHNAKPASEKVHTRRIVISHPFETVQEVEIQEPVTKYQQVTVNEPAVYNTASVGFNRIQAGLPGYSVEGHSIQSHPYPEQPIQDDYNYVH